MHFLEIAWKPLIDTLPDRASAGVSGCHNPYNRIADNLPENRTYVSMHIRVSMISLTGKHAFVAAFLRRIFHEYSQSNRHESRNPRRNPKKPPLMMRIHM